MDGRCVKEDCVLIRFIVIARKGLDNVDFDLNNLTCGRMDLKARCTISTLFISNGIRRNCSITFLNDVIGRSLTVTGNDVKSLFCSERDICASFRAAMREIIPSSERKRDGQKKKASSEDDSGGTEEPGVTFSGHGDTLEDTLTKRKDCVRVFLDVEGEHIAAFLSKKEIKER
jgi:tRNA pseudouridine-54 N-methylase